jgi:hypothetical protein
MNVHFIYIIQFRKIPRKKLKPQASHEIPFIFETRYFITIFTTTHYSSLS